MTEYEVSNSGQTFFVPKYAVDTFLPDFIEGLESYLAAQSAVPLHKQQSAYRVLAKHGIKEADKWLATLLVAPVATVDTGFGAGELNIGAFVKYYSKAWGLLDPRNPRDGYEAVLRIIRVFFDTTGLVDQRTDRPRGQVEQQVNFALTEFGKSIYPELGIEVADEAHSETLAPHARPVEYEYMSAPWLQSVDDDHLVMQHPDVEERLANQATAASSVGFVIPENIAKVYNDWFKTSKLPPRAETKLERFLLKKERHKIVNVRRMQKQRRQVISEIAGKVMYYPVGFDRKARQYMMGYPLNPQGAKADRPLFYVVAPEAPKAKVLASLTAEGEELFGGDWAVVSELTHDELLNHNDDFVKQVCTTKGEPDLHKYTVLLEYAKQKEDK